MYTQYQVQLRFLQPLSLHKHAHSTICSYRKEKQGPLENRLKKTVNCEIIYMKKTFESKKAIDCGTGPYSTRSLTFVWGSREPQSGRLTAPTQSIPLVEAPLLFSMPSTINNLTELRTTRKSLREMPKTLQTLLPIQIRSSFYRLDPRTQYPMRNL